MREIGVGISLLSPTLLSGAPPASNQLDTLRFIPGNTLRGLMARRYLDLGHNPESEEFRRLFLTGEVRYGFAFAEGAEVLPLSARSCKYESGFRAEGGHGVADLLLPGADGCPGCGRPLDYFRGFWLPGERREVTVDTRLVTRTAIDPQRGTARPGQLYSQRVLSEGQSFHAALEAPDDLAPQLLEILDGGFEAALGTGGSRGQGWAEVRALDEAPAAHSSARARYERFRAAAARPVLVVTLLTDALFRDDYLREATAPALADLAALGIRPEDWEPQPARAFMDLRQVFGFDGIPVRLPRPPRIAVAAGSVFLFEAREGREPMIPEGEGKGWIGEGHGEGYGRAVLWHPFHVDPEKSDPEGAGAMTLETSLGSDRELAALEEQLIRRARELYRLGFNPRNLSPSQMSAVGELLRTAPSRQEAQAAVEGWLGNQLTKLREEEKKKGKVRSWLEAPGPGGAKTSLGEELLDWIAGDRFLGMAPPEELDRLVALRRFWERLHGFYRFENVTGGEMSLAALDLPSDLQGGEPR